MEIFINNQLTTVQPDLNLSDLVKEILSQDTIGIAIAVNNKVISKKVWQEQKLNHQDKVTIITATQGG